MTYTGLELFMENLKQLIYCKFATIIHSSTTTHQFYLKGLNFNCFMKLGSMIQTLFINEHQNLHELENVRDLKKRFKDAAEEAQDFIDLFVTAVNFRNKGLPIRSDFFKSSLNLEDVMRSIKSIKEEFITILDTMKMDSSTRTDRLETHYAAAAGTSCTRNLLGKKKVLEEIVVGLDRDAELIRDKLAQDQKQLDVVSIVGMGGLGKTTLATKVFNNRFVVYHFHVHAWVTVSQTYEKRDLLIQILESIGIELDPVRASETRLFEMLHTSLKFKRYLIVIDDIWSNEAWDDLKLFFPNDNTGSRVLLTTRLKEVALHAKSPGFVHQLEYLKDEESWELLPKKVFHGNDCPKSLIEPGMQIAKNCHGLPLAVVVIAGVLVKEAVRKDSWERIAQSVSSFIVSDRNGYTETLALSYDHLPHHLRDCFLYLGGFPEDHKFRVRSLIWLWVAEGFIQEARNRSLEEIAEDYLIELVDRNLLVVADRKFNGGIKACFVHYLLREICLEKATKESFFLKIHRPNPCPLVTIMPSKERRIFTNNSFCIKKYFDPPNPNIRSFCVFILTHPWVATLLSISVPMCFKWCWLYKIVY